MKTLILGPLDYASAKKDLILFNHDGTVYSVYFVLEGLINHEAKEGRKLDNLVAISMLLAQKMTDKEYQSSDIFFGMAPKKYHFDRVICYNYELLEAQESEIADHYNNFYDEFWSTLDCTEDYNGNIMEAIKHAKSKTAASDQLDS